MKEEKPAVTSPNRYKQLDSLRGLAALAVFVDHILWNKIETPVIGFWKTTPLGVLFNGSAAVMFFFVLSGFVLSLPFINNEKPLKITEFYTKRIFRIYPALLFAVILSLLLKMLVYDHFVIHRILGEQKLIGNWSWTDCWNWGWSKEYLKEIVKTFLLIGPPFNNKLIDPPIWSLVIEMKISIILPFFIMIIARSSAVLNVVFLVIITYLTYDHIGAWPIGVFYSGILMAKYKDQILSIISSWSTVILIVAVVFGIFLYNNSYEFSNTTHHKDIWSKYIMALGSCILMMIVLAKKQVSRFFEHRIFTFFGDISYSFYLIHMPFIITMGALFTGRSAFSDLYILVGSFFLAVITSRLMFIYIEKPFQKLGAKLTSRFKIFSAIPI